MSDDWVKNVFGVDPAEYAPVPAAELPDSAAISTSGSGVLLVAAGGKSDPPADGLEEGEGQNRDGTVRRKGGDHGRFRGGESKGEQDRIIEELVKKYKLTKDERRKLHDEVSGQNYGHETIEQVAQDIVNERDGINEENDEETAPEDLDDEGEILKNKHEDPRSQREILRDFLISLGVSAGIASIIAAILALGGFLVLAEMRKQECTEDQVQAVAAKYGWDASAGQA